MSAVRVVEALHVAERLGHEVQLRQTLLERLFEATFEVKQFRGLVEWFESGKTLTTGDRVPAGRYVQMLNEVPILKAAVMKYAERPELQDIRKQAEPALLSSITEFVLEGLHVNNRLNKAAKAGEQVYRR